MSHAAPNPAEGQDTKQTNTLGTEQYPGHGYMGTDVNVGSTQPAYPGHGHMNPDIDVGSAQPAYPGHGYLSTDIRVENPQPAYPGHGQMNTTAASSNAEHVTGGHNSGTHVVQDLTTGEVRTHRTAVGAALDEATQKVKAFIPGTQAYKSEHGDAAHDEK